MWAQRLKNPADMTGRATDENQAQARLGPQQRQYLSTIMSAFKEQTTAG